MAGLPDGVWYDAVEKVLWVALFTPVPKVAKIVEILLRWVRRMLARLPNRVFALRTTAMVLGLTEMGKVRWVVGDKKGRLGSICGWGI